MKKLMIAALAVAGLAAFADDCAPEVKEYPLVYQLKASVKTTKGVTSSVTTPGSVCTPGDEGTTSSTVLRAKDTTTWGGWIYTCTATCDTIATGSVVAWDSKRKAEITTPVFKWNVLNILKGQSVAEAEWDFTGKVEYDDTRAQEIDVTGAGFGTYSVKKGYYTGFSGYFAGTMDASYDLSSKAKNCDPSQIWQCPDLAPGDLKDASTIAYGTWSIKYNASASKKLEKGILTVPSYVTPYDPQ